MDVCRSFGLLLVFPFSTVDVFLRIILTIINLEQCNYMTGTWNRNANTFETFISDKTRWLHPNCKLSGFRTFGFSVTPELFVISLGRWLFALVPNVFFVMPMADNRDLFIVGTFMTLTFYDVEV